MSAATFGGSSGPWRARRIIALLVTGLLCIGAAWSPDACAWWNSDWAYRKKILLHAGAAGTEDTGPVENAVVAVRLHSGNFPFIDAREAGEDLRFVAGDDKTPLPFHLEVFDGINGIAVAWVQIPRLEQAAKPGEIWLYYGNPEAPGAAASAVTFDTATIATYHFGRRETAPLDATGSALNAASSTAASVAEGVSDFALRFRTQDAFAIPNSPAWRVAAGGAITVSGWLRLKEQPVEGRVLTYGSNGAAIEMHIRGASLVGRIRESSGNVVEAIAQDRLPAGAWHHFAFTVGGRAVLYVDGVEVASVAASLPALEGPVTVGALAETPGFEGDLDELQFSRVARNPGWVRVAALGQGPDGRVVELGPDEAQASGGQYVTLLRVLASSVSRDAWVIIGLIAILGFLSVETIIAKAGLLRRAERANRGFLEQFRRAGADLAALGQNEPGRGASGTGAAAPSVFADSGLYRMYRIAADQLPAANATGTADGRGPVVESADMNLLRASLDTAMVEEVERLNQRMVLLTLSVSGAPFLGLLGTVVGIMITFATIALQGDVNVNTIAPGVAAAITTTVAGLIVAIPAMFAYNFLTLRIRSLTTAMELFQNELLGRIARLQR